MVEEDLVQEIQTPKLEEASKMTDETTAATPQVFLFLPCRFFGFILWGMIIIRRREGGEGD
jgi:hypothetical protein